MDGRDHAGRRSAPRPIGPQPAPVVLGLGAIALVVAAAAMAWHLQAGAPTDPDPAPILAEVEGVLFPVPAIQAWEDSPVIRRLFLPLDDRREIIREVEADRMRLGALFVWDTLDPDGDAVRISSAGYAQDVVITTDKQMFYVPYRPGASVRITALADGGGGGVTLGVQTTLGQVPLPHLPPGGTMDIPVL